MKKVSVIGDGVFGTFLKKEFSKVAPDQFDLDQTNSDILILAVPSSAYDQVAQNHFDKHLVNVCSVQAIPNYICTKWTNRVTGIHPLFGPRTKTARHAIVTKKCDESNIVIDLFRLIMDTDPIEMLDSEGLKHDEIMSLTHVEVVKLQSQIMEIMRKTKSIPDEVCPTSFLKLRAFADTFGDMPPGTLESIYSNPFINK